jgi:hypothetical protein
MEQTLMTPECPDQGRQAGDREEYDYRQIELFIGRINVSCSVFELEWHK